MSFERCGSKGLVAAAAERTEPGVVRADLHTACKSLLWGTCSWQRRGEEQAAARCLSKEATTSPRVEKHVEFKNAASTAAHAVCGSLPGNSEVLSEGMEYQSESEVAIATVRTAQK